LEEPEFAGLEDAGIVIQTYLKDAERDLADLAAWAKQRGRKVGVRLVKGAYWDYERVIAAQRGWSSPVFEHKWETDASYEKLTEFLMRHHDVLSPAIASHNVRSIAHAIAVARHVGMPLEALEFQLLHGMAEPIKRALVKMGCRVRIYLPSGHLIPGMGYLVRRILENTSNESFLRQSFIKHTAEEELLASPSEVEREWKARNVQVSKAVEDGAPRATARSHEFVNEPDTDFSRESNRKAMRAALAHVKGQFGRAHHLHIGGREVHAQDVMERRNPSRLSEIVGVVDLASRADAEKALDAAHGAFPAWRATPPAKRVEYMAAAALVLRRRRFELTASEVYEVGKGWREADADVSEAIDYLEYYAQEMLRLAEPRRMGRVPGEMNWYHYEPRGVAVVIAPWNFPLAILCGMTSAAIVAGNTAIMKPAGQSSVIAAELMEAFREAGLPDGVVNYLPGPGKEVGAYLVASPRVDLVAFTGSREVGLAINAAAGQTQKGQESPKRVIAEMGGKNAVIVDSDADLDEAVVGVSVSAFGYQGQKCSAASRVIVLEDIYDVFLARLVEHARSLKIGPADDPASTVGPLVDEGALKKVREYIAIGKSEKARLAFSAEIPDGLTGYYVGPTIFAEVPPAARIAQEEIFGPVLAVIKVKTFQEALKIANATEYALTGGVYSRSPAHVELAKREFHVGNLYINRKITGAMVGRQPFGGFKMSGIGSKAGGPDYLLQFLLPRTISENTLRHGFTPSSSQGP
jgi:RHH-type proline utilization regulon transcriptional repressor/proline dehydrogenase/delta 1-pyrroline-5-carboxylate dehydrogenase